jgi:hypothetical protein
MASPPWLKFCHALGDVFIFRFGIVIALLFERAQIPISFSLIYDFLHFTYHIKFIINYLLGKLLGIAIRSKEYLALSIPSLIWKLLVSDTPTVEDLEGIDSSLVKSINTLRRIDEEGVDSQTFRSLIV